MKHVGPAEPLGVSDVAGGDEDALPTYGLLVGQRLRLVRQQRRLTLQEVDQLSGGEIKA